MNELAIKRALSDSTCKQEVIVGGKGYALHITRNREAVITDNQDYGKVYAVVSLDFFNLLELEAQSVEGSGITIVCREVDRSTGRVATYVCKKDVADRDLQICGIRGRLNPELKYFAIRTCVANDPEALEDVLSLLQRRGLTDEIVDRYGGIVRL